MPDPFDQRLRAGAEHFGASLRPGPAPAIRARGEQRRKRRVAASAVLAVSFLAGGGTAALAVSNQAPAASSPSALGEKTNPVRTASVQTPSQPGASTGGGAWHTGGPHAGKPSAGASHTAGTPAAKSTAKATSGAPAKSSGSSKTLQLGNMTIQVPPDFSITYSDGSGDYTVGEGYPCTPGDLDGGAEGSACPSFSVITVNQISSSPPPVSAGIHAFDPGAPYAPFATTEGCPHYPSGPGAVYRDSASASEVNPAGQTVRVLSGQEAEYMDWNINCTEVLLGHQIMGFDQRIWYVPSVHIIVVDEYDTENLQQILVNGTWK